MSEIDPPAQKVILPIIRNVMAALLADEICRVQPMSSPHNKEDWPYQIDVLAFSRYSDLIPMKRWCSETFNEDEWTATVQFFAFKTEEALSWFLLKWR